LSKYEDWLNEVLGVEPGSAGMGYYVEKSEETGEYYNKARYLEAILCQILDGARFSQANNAWVVKFKAEYLNQLRNLVGMGETGRTESPDDLPPLSMWPEKDNE
jgi:hypothetical protein